MMKKPYIKEKLNKTKKKKNVIYQTFVMHLKKNKKKMKKKIKMKMLMLFFLLLKHGNLCCFFITGFKGI